MKGLLRVLNEALSDEGKARMERLMRRMSDEDIDNIETELNLKSHKISAEDESSKNYKIYDNFLKSHNFKNMKFQSGKNAFEVFLDVFKNNIGAFKKIAKNNGTISINQMPDEGNVFDYCIGWENEALALQKMQFKTNANVGDFEVLLNLIIKEASNSNKGDLAIDGNKNFELKAITAKSGPHVNGQKNVERNWVISYVLNKCIFGMGDKEAEVNARNQSTTYFQSKKNVESAFKNALFENKTKIQDLAEALVLGIAYQYNVAKPNDIEEYATKKKISNAFVNNIIKGSSWVTDAIREFYDERSYSLNGIATQKANNKPIFSLIGKIQLYFYIITEEIDYFMCVYDGYLDANSSNGNYILLKNLNGSKCNFAEYINNPCLNRIMFKAVGEAESDRSKTGKIDFSPSFKAARA